MSNIYVDFDRTLFDTDKFLEDLDNVLMNFNIDVNTFLEYVKKDEENGFNPGNVLKIMEKEYSINKDIYKEIEDLIKKSEQYVYSDVYSFMRSVKEKNYKIFILTKGNNEYQLSKIRNTSLFNYLDGVLVTLKLKGELDLNYKDSIFIDDNPKELESIIKRKPQRIIRIERKNAKYNMIKLNKNLEIVSDLTNIKI